MAIRFAPRVAVANGERILESGTTGTVVYPGATDPAPITEDREGNYPLTNAQIAVTPLGLVPEFWCQDDDAWELDWLAADGVTRVPMQALPRSRLIPEGGEPGEVLTRASGDPTDYYWAPVAGAPDPTTASEGQVIRLVGGQWVAADLPAGGGGVATSIDGGKP